MKERTTWPTEIRNFKKKNFEMIFSSITIACLFLATTVAFNLSPFSREPAYRASFLVTPRRVPLSPSPLCSTATQEETFSFTSDVRRTMEIIINSLYSDRAVFLRELVSNAADACDKRRFLSISKESSGGEDGDDDMGIRIRVDKDSRTITIEDNGVGMTKDELVNNLGQIAMSGTKAFSEAMKTSEGDASTDNLIGQFGVGFYSAFLVADRVAVETKGMESSEWLKWER